MGKLRLEASWCKSRCANYQVQIELDLMGSVLLIKLVIALLLS